MLASRNHCHVNKVLVTSDERLTLSLPLCATSLNLAD